jgi:alpha-2-macroglobulin
MLETAQISVMSKHLVNRLHTDKYLNTQERAFALLALGTIASQKQSNSKTHQRTNSR